MDVKIKTYLSVECSIQLIFWIRRDILLVDHVLGRYPRRLYGLVLRMWLMIELGFHSM